MEILEKHLSSLKSARVLFCPSHLIDDFLSKYHEYILAHTLILGNSDRDFYKEISNLPKSIVRVYCQNLIQPIAGYSAIPIGLENLKLGNNGQTKFFDSKYLNVKKEAAILVGPFSRTHSERDGLILNESKRVGNVQYLSGRLSTRNFATISSSFKFIAAPRGNGLDTHRFWEALYRGSYPIVLKSYWADSLKKLGIPLVTISSWGQEELENVAKMELPSFDPKNIEALWMPYWERVIVKYES